jgi:nitrous oxide reductase accessory protein NosL
LKPEKEEKRMKTKIPIVLFFLVLILAGCNTSIDEEKEQTAQTVEDTFKNTNKNAKEKAGNLSFYLPFGAKIEKESKNNVIISKGSDTFILFTNPEEDQNSKLLYSMAISDEKNIVQNDSFKEDDRLGYYVIKKLPDSKEYELIVGVGGTKLTTQSSLEDLSDHAEMMMEIADSVKQN